MARYGGAVIGLVWWSCHWAGMVELSLGWYGGAVIGLVWWSCHWAGMVTRMLFSTHVALIQICHQTLVEL